MSDTVEILENPEKSSNDKNSYRVIRLSNGLKALLVSDPNEQSKIPAVNEKEEKLSAICVCVEVGSFSDPRDVQGMAHFLEHMISMGSEKYPDENSFSLFISKNGGNDNATTDYEQTTFYFDVKEQCLDEALDRFSHFFKAPLLRKEAMTREREAVDSEFTMNSKNDMLKLFYIISSLAQADHPFTIFSWGNLKTLKDNIDDETLHKKVIDFWKRHYSSHRMHICIQSRQSLNDLQNLIVKHFAAVPNNLLPPLDFSMWSHKNTFRSEFFEKVFYLKSEQTTAKLIMTWCLPPTNYLYNPSRCFEYLLGSDANGTLSSYLKHKLWSTGLMSGTGRDSTRSNSFFSLYQISITLTDEGFDHLDEVLEAIFSYLKFLQNVGINEELFKDFQKISELGFRFASLQNTRDNVQSLAKNLRQYPSKHVLNGNQLLFEYKPDELKKFIDHLCSREFNIIISKQKYDDSFVLDKTEPWFSTKYREIDMPAKWIELWRNPKQIDEFKFREPNPFVSDDFTILYDDSKTLPKYPVKVFENDICELWHRQDDKYLLPKTCVRFYFISSSAVSTARNMALLALYSNLLQDELTVDLYAAREANFVYSVLSLQRGIFLSVCGFSQKIPKVIDTLIDCLRNLKNKVTEKQFYTIRENNLKKYENIFLSPTVLVTEFTWSLIDHNRATIIDRYKKLATISFEDFKNFEETFFTQIKLKVLMQGNLTENDARDNITNVLARLEASKIEDVLECKAVKIPLGMSYFRCKSFKLIDSNTVTKNIYQIGLKTQRLKVILNLFLMITKQYSFDILRNKEQLGYYVKCDIDELHGVLHFYVQIMSQENKFSAEYIDDRIENFLNEFLTILTNMPDQMFLQYKKSSEEVLLADDYRLESEIVRNWDEIQKNQYQFDTNLKSLEILRTLTKNDLIEFYHDNFGANKRKLSIQIIGSDESVDRLNDTNEDHPIFDKFTMLDFKTAHPGQLITDIREFKVSIETFPPVQFV